MKSKRYDPKPSIHLKPKKAVKRVPPRLTTWQLGELIFMRLARLEHRIDELYQRILEMEETHHEHQRDPGND